MTGCRVGCRAAWMRERKPRVQSILYIRAPAGDNREARRPLGAAAIVIYQAGLGSLLAGRIGRCVSSDANRPTRLCAVVQDGL